MKRIGLIGGLSWHSTMAYYQYINEEINCHLGKQHSADLILISLNFESILLPWQKGNWSEALAPIINSVNQLENSGADFFLLCSNTVHKFADKITASTNIPMLHIGEVVSDEIHKKRIKKVGFLGTKVSMGSDFYHHPLAEKGISMLLPEKQEQSVLEQLIFSEFTKGIFSDKAFSQIKRVINGLESKGAEAIILGCTELPLLVSNKKFGIPICDSLKMHAMAAAEMALHCER